jgi:hypothetical protein
VSRDRMRGVEGSTFGLSVVAGGRKSPRTYSPHEAMFGIITNIRVFCPIS